MDSSSPLIRLLLANDGSMTVLLEALIGGKVKANVLSVQELSGCEYFEGEAIRRETVLEGCDKKLLHAVCHIEKSAYERMGFGQGIPIGLAMKKMKLEQYREIYRAEKYQISVKDSEYLGILPAEVYKRSYVVYNQGSVFMHISEVLLPDLISLCSP